MNALTLRHGDLAIKQKAYNSVPKNNIYIVCDDINDCWNLGSILRIGDALGVKEVIFTGSSELPTNKQVRRSSMMLADVMSWSYYSTTAMALESLRNVCKTIVALEVSPNAIDYRKVNFGPLVKDGLAIILGNENRGISEEILTKADLVVKLPMFGINDSLNVSMALTVLGYHVLKEI